MGIRRQRRNRLESPKNLNDVVLYSLGTDNINYEKYDEQVLYKKVNERLDVQQAKLNKKFGLG